MKGKCFRCGEGHPKDQCSQKGNTLKCTSCNRKDHLAKECYSTMLKLVVKTNAVTAEPASHPALTLRALHQSSNKNLNECCYQHSIQSPNGATKQPSLGRQTNCGSRCTLKPILAMWMWLEGINGRKNFQIKAVQDSGAMMSMISLHILQKHKVPLNISNIGYKVKDVQKNQIPHQGMADFYSKSNGFWMAIRVVVSANIGDNMLIAYQDLLKFQAIHINFQYEVLTYTVKADILAKIKHKFWDVLNDSLNTIPMKTPSPMIINLKENAKPLNVLAARRVPKRFEEAAEITIKDLISKGVLAWVSNTTDWCSPGFFMPKPDGRVLQYSFRRQNSIPLGIRRVLQK